MENLRPERKTTISEVVGGTLESHGRINRAFEVAFDYQERFPGEREKSSAELELIDALNLRIKDFTKSFGGSFVSVPQENIHVVDLAAKEITESRRGPPFTGPAAFSPVWQGIAVHHPRPEPSLQFALNIVHEMLHFQSFQSVKAGKSDRPELRRIGLNVYNVDGTAARFGKLDEAVITELEKRFDRRFFEDIAYTRALVEARNKEIAASKGKSLRVDIEKIVDDIALLETEPLPGGGKRVRIVGYEYPNERRDLWALVDRVVESLHGSMDREAVFRLFARAVLNGRLLPLARVLERALGKGSFRILAELATDRGPDSDAAQHERTD